MAANTIYNSHQPGSTAHQLSLHYFWPLRKQSHDTNAALNQPHFHASQEQQQSMASELLGGAAVAASAALLLLLGPMAMDAQAVSGGGGISTPLDGQDLSNQVTGSCC
jgi:hypothetical protein